MSCRHSRLSTGREAFIARITASGPAAKRPPQTGSAAGPAPEGPQTEGVGAPGGGALEGSQAGEAGLVMRWLAVLAALALGACGGPAPSGGAAGGQGAPGGPPGAAAAGGAAGGSPAAVRPRAGPDRSHAGTPAPDVPLETGPDGATETVAALARAEGRPVLVNLWATWCAPCVRELPTLDRLQAEMGRRLLVVPVSQDMEGWRAVSPAFTAERYPHLSTRVDSAMAFGSALGLRALPVTILYDANGREVWRYLGDLDWTSAEARALIAQGLASG